MLETAIRFIVKMELISVLEDIKELKKQIKELRKNKQ